MKKTPPVADKHPVEKSAHGVTWTDDYDWLRAENWQACVRDPGLLPQPIHDYLAAENEWYDLQMQDTEDLQQTLIAEMKSRIAPDDQSVPVKDGPWAYFHRYRAGDEHQVYLRQPREGGAEETLLDLNELAAAHEYFDAGDIDHSPDHRYLAWTADTNGSEYFRLAIRDLSNGQDIEFIEDVGGVTWATGTSLFYSRVDESHRPSKIFWHRLGANPAEDVLVHDEADPRFFCSVWTSRSGDYVFIGINMNDQSEIRFIPTANPGQTPQLIEVRTEGLEYDVEHQGERFIILTNADGATDFKIVQAPVASPSRSNWQDLVPYQPGKMVLSIAAYRDWLLWIERENALPCLRYLGVGGESGELAFEEQAYSLSMQPEIEFDSDSFRYGYESPTTPSQVFSHDLRTGTRVLLKTREIPAGHNPADYRVERVQAPSTDGELVPVTILYHRSTVLDGSAPCLLYGYGSYGAAMPASFSGSRLSLVDRGFVYAIAHVRGGEEKGRAWYEAAKFGGKPKTFDDFIAVGEHLVRECYTARERIVIEGGSAGGLLVGAALNRSPDLWGGAIADVPFVDVLNTILDASLPLTPGEWSQWGNPIESEQAFRDIQSYSPYENVQARPYPPMLVTCGVSDPRVTYWEAAKWVARHRSLRSDSNLLVLKTNMSSGHFGQTGRYGMLGDTARSQAFAIKVLQTGLP